ncbi:hypothetical protein MKZ02_22225 [Pseudobacillus sp. FSL P4-0506]|uniref:hypothetical protein n=1 Tax=unclassified Pseudobacillus TaxID=2619284 RepID=UPI0030FC003C
MGVHRTLLYIPAIGKTGELAVMVGDEAIKAIAGVQSKTWRNEIAPRALIEMMKYKPSNVANKIKGIVMVSMIRKHKGHRR